MFVDYFFLGLKNLKQRGIRSWLTLLGILVGITAVVALISLGSGMKAAVNSQFGVQTTEMIIVQAGGITAGLPGSSVISPLKISDVAAIENLGKIELAIGRNLESVKVEFNDRLIMATAASASEGEYRKFDIESQEMEAIEGRLLKDGDIKKVHIGNNYLDGNKNGFNKGIRVGNTLLINNEEFKVVGILKKKGSFIVDNAIIINYDVLDDLVDFNDEVDLISVKIKHKDLMDEAKEDIEDLLRKRRDVDKGEEDFSVETPEAALQTVNQILSGVQAFIILIAFISILVGAIGIINTMTTSVLERKKEIGIMKAVGARNSDIFLQFFVEAGLMGFVGGLIGVILGVIIGVLGTLAINNFIGSTTSPQLNFWLIFGALIGSFLIGSISGIIPAMNAAKQNPVEALRG